MLQVVTEYSSENAEIATLYLSGSLEITTTMILDEKIKQLKHVDIIKIDFKELTFIDSTGVGAILDIIYHAKTTKAKVEFISLSGYTKEIFETIGVMRVLEALQR